MGASRSKRRTKKPLKKGIQTSTQDIHNPHLMTPSSARRYLTPKEARTVYSQMRSLAIKRLKRFEGTRYTNSQIYKYGVNRFPKLAELDERQVYSAIVDVRNFLRNKRSTLTGIKQAESKTLSTLHRHGFTYITADNLYRFGQFMEYKRSQNIGKWFDSVRAAEEFEELESLDRDELEQEFNDYNNRDVGK